jgi:hypothetical protein
MKGLVRVGIAAAIVAALLGFGALPAFATHVQCGDVITQDTKLDNDLLNCPPDAEPNPPPFRSALTIGANNVTLDLNGHTLQTSVVFAGTGTTGADNSGGYYGLTVKNGTIDHYEYPVLINGGADNVVTNVNLSGRGGVVARGASGLQINRSVIEGGAWGGIYLMDAGSSRIEDNVVTRGESGIGVSSQNPQARIVVRRNLLDRNDFGIDLGVEGSGAVVEHNVVTNSPFGTGIYATVGSSGTTSSSTTSGTESGLSDPRPFRTTRPTTTAISASRPIPP